MLHPAGSRGRHSVAGAPTALPVRRIRAGPLRAAVGAAAGACAALGAWPLGSAAQAGAAPVTVAGSVVDTWKGDAVEGALVRFLETVRRDGTRIFGITDTDGRFAIADVPPGPSRISVTRLGYADLYQVLDIRDGQFVEVALIPQPVVLEGIEVYVDRLETRLREIPYVTSTFLERDLRAAPDLSVAAYLDSQAGFAFVPCYGDLSGTGLFRPARNCMRTRGTIAQRPSVYVDDAPAFGGVPELASIPTTQIYRVEVIRGCGQIRVYTNTYVEGTAVQPRPLLPIVC